MIRSPCGLMLYGCCLLEKEKIISARIKSLGYPYPNHYIAFIDHSNSLPVTYMY